MALELGDVTGMTEVVDSVGIESADSELDVAVVKS